MHRVKTPQTRCRAAIGKIDITPPVGIYHRMWGAALHDQATGVHRPLEASVLWLEQRDGGGTCVVISLDHCILDADETRRIRQSIATATGVRPEQVMVTLTHTHGSGWMSRSRSHLPGGDKIGPYLDQMTAAVAKLAAEVRTRVEPATIVYGTGQCTLAAYRDFYDAARKGYVCGFDPDGPADDTIIAARVVNDQNKTVATLVNYACHPTTLAWENTLLSPDWVGAMRETIETHEGGVCLFLQGASGELGPREGYVGDPAIADRNGRQVGFSALAALSALPRPGTEFVYSGAVVSGAILGTWKHQPVGADEVERQSAWQWHELTAELPYRHDLPTIEQTRDERTHWEAEEAKARASGDTARLRDCRAEIEQRSRQLTRLELLTPGKSYPLTLTIGVLGDAIWIFTPGELYQVFQVVLRRRFAPRAILIATNTNDWQPGYVPAVSTFGYGIYQEIIAAVAPGSLESLIEIVSRKLEEVVGGE